MSCIGCVPTSENEKQTSSKGVLGDAQVNILPFIIFSILLVSYSVWQDNKNKNIYIEVHRSLSVSVFSDLIYPWSYVVVVVVFTFGAFLLLKIIT